MLAVEKKISRRDVKGMGQTYILSSFYIYRYNNLNNNICIHMRDMKHARESFPASLQLSNSALLNDNYMLLFYLFIYLFICINTMSYWFLQISHIQEQLYLSKNNYMAVFENWCNP